MLAEGIPGGEVGSECPCWIGVQIRVQAISVFLHGQYMPAILPTLLWAACYCSGRDCKMVLVTRVYQRRCIPISRGLALLCALVLVAGACGGASSDDDSSVGDIAPDEGVPSGSGSPDEGVPSGGDPSRDDSSGSDETTAGTLVVPLDTVPEETNDDQASADGRASSEGQTADTLSGRDGTLRVAVEAESDGLNPAANNFSASAYVMVMPVVEPLAYWDADGNWMPYLAESFTKIGDGSSWQVKLREGVRFHDGTELDADDVTATFKAQIAHPILARILKPAFPAVGAVEKIDDRTVQYNPKAAYARFPALLTGQVGMVLPSEWVARARQDRTLNQMPVGTGPFKMEKRIQDEVTVLVRNPDYWAADTVDIHLDRIEIHPMADIGVAAERLEAGSLDLLVTAQSEAIRTLRDADDVSTIENPRMQELLVVLNAQRVPFDDIRARQAFAFATPKNAFHKIIDGDVAPPADTMFHPDLVWHNPDVVQESDMPERAGPLVEAYCSEYPDNCTVGKINMEFQHAGTSVEQTRKAELLTDGWQDYFNVTRQELPADDHIRQAALGKFDAMTWRQFGSIDPDSDMVPLLCSTIGVVAFNMSRYCDEGRDALMLEQRNVNDNIQRIEIWHEVQRMIKESYEYVFLSHVNWTIGARNNVRNICGQIAPGTGVKLFCNNRGRVILSQVWLE